MTNDELKVLRDLYGVAQDLHSQLANRTSIAETERFMPPIIAAAELLERSEPERCVKIDPSALRGPVNITNNGPGPLVIYGEGVTLQPGESWSSTDPA